LLEQAKNCGVGEQAGVDNIDLDEATKRGVLVMSTPAEVPSVLLNTLLRCCWRWFASFQI